MLLDLVSLSRLQLEQYNASRTIFPVEDIWHSILEDALFETSQNSLELLVENNIKDNAYATLNGNVKVLSSALENLIRNAQKYAQSKIKVGISLVQEEQRNILLLSVDDDGEGVPDSELENIFRPFYRIDEARARQTGGTGLGLTIVANAVTQHEGNVKASRSHMGGLCVEIILPLWIEA